MDLLQNRTALSSAGMAVGFGLLIAWMMPPTEPQQMAPNWRAHFKPIAPPAPIDFVGYAPAVASMPTYPVDQLAYDSDGSGGDVAIYRGRSSDEDLSLTGNPSVDRDSSALSVGDPPMPSYHDGYRSARGDAASSRDCRGALSAATEDGCVGDDYAQRVGAGVPEDDRRPAERDGASVY
jgi:hypothetical protein